MRESTEDKTVDLLYKIFFAVSLGLGVSLSVMYYKVFAILSHVGIYLLDNSAIAGAY